MTLKLSKHGKLSHGSDLKQEKSAELPLLSPRATAYEMTPKKSTPKFFYTKTPGDFAEALTTDSAPKQHYNGFRSSNNHNNNNNMTSRDNFSSSERSLLPVSHQKELFKSEISLFREPNQRNATNSSNHKKIQSEPDVILVTEYDTAPSTSRRGDMFNSTKQASGFRKRGVGVRSEASPNNPKNIRSYPSKRLIFQKKLETLKAKIQENEDVNLDEYQDLEDWFETLNLKFNDVLFSNTYDIFIYSPEVYNLTWRPSSREGATLNKVGEYVVIYGGTTSGYSDDILLFEPKRSRWFIPDCGDTKPTFNRHGHSAIPYYNFLLIFGGERQNLRSFETRELLDDVWMFDVQEHSFRKLNTKGSIDDQILQRKHHAASLGNNKMYIYGGVGEKGQLLNDVWELDLRTSFWKEVDMDSCYYENGIARHRMCYVADQYHRGLREGLYTFGGKDENDQVINTLKVLTVNTKEPKWYYPEVKGQPPSPRYDHTMEYYPSLNALIIYGGRCDRKVGFHELKEIRMYNLMVMMWSTVQINGERPDARYLHCSAIFEDKLLVFGGLSNYVFKESQILIVELNPEVVQKLIDKNVTGVETSRKGLKGTNINPHWSQEKANQIIKITLASPIVNRWQKVEETIGEHRDFPSYLPTPKKETYAKIYADAMKSFARNKNKTKAEIEQEKREEQERERQKEIEQAKSKLLKRKRLIKPTIRDLELQNLLRYFQKQQDGGDVFAHKAS